jgi:long-chain fatty acid transport protein
MKRFILLSAVIFLSELCCSSLSVAGGFQVNLQGQKQTGMGHTGTGLLSDASCVFFNPGGMTFLDSSISVVAGASFIIPRTQYLELNPGTYTAEMEHHTGTPFNFYFSERDSSHPQFSAGLGIYTPFGSRAQWANDWKGQFIIREINLKTIFIQPTISYQLTSNIGVGIGVIIGTGDFSLRKGIPVQDLSRTYGEANLNGNASGWGMNAGIFFKATDQLSIGVSYRSKVTMRVKDGDAEFSVPGYLADYFPATTFYAGLNLPQVFNVGIGYKVNENLRLAMDVNRVGWSAYDSLQIDFKENTEKLEDISSARNYKDVFIFRIGAEYYVSHKVTVRGGGYYDVSPVLDGYVTPEAPDADRIGITAGASFHVNGHLTIDASFLYNESKERTGINLETQFGGTFKTKTIVPGVGVEYRF